MPVGKKKIFVLGLIVVLAVFKIRVLDDYRLLFDVAYRLQEPSKSFYLVVNRIYKLAETKDFSDELMADLSNGRKQHLQNLYFRVLGCVGGGALSEDLKRVYSNKQNDREARALLHTTILSLGMAGNDDDIKFLEKLVEKYDNLNVQVSGAVVAASLYLLTGENRWEFRNSSGRMQRLVLGEKLSSCRRVVMSSKGRRRSYDEMIVLDRVYRR